MKKVANLALTVMLVACFSTSTFANGLSLNSVGTKALGMGGAFVALSNDATAIYWNPAGLVGQESSVLAYFTGVMPIGTYQFAPVGIDAKMESKLYPTGGLIGNYKDGKLDICFRCLCSCWTWSILEFRRFWCASINGS